MDRDRQRAGAISYMGGRPNRGMRSAMGREIERGTGDPTGRVLSAGVLLIGVVAPIATVLGSALDYVAVQTADVAYMQATYAVGFGLLILVVVAAALVAVASIARHRRLSREWLSSVDPSRILRLVGLVLPTCLAIDLALLTAAPAVSPLEAWRTAVIIGMAFLVGLVIGLAFHFLRKESLAQRGTRERVLPVPIETLVARLKQKGFVTGKVVKNPLTGDLVSADLAEDDSVLRLQRTAPTKTQLRLASTSDWERIARLLEDAAAGRL